MEFQAFPKIARLKRQIVVTEKIDGSNGQIGIFPILSEQEFEYARANDYCLIVDAEESGGTPMVFFVGSRKRWIAPEGTVFDPVNECMLKGTDNFGFANWAFENVNELMKLGEGRHFGEWYGLGIQRGYGLEEKRFALFNTSRWGAHNPNTPACCDVVPVLATGDDVDTTAVLQDLTELGSSLVPGFMNPEGIIVYHSASRTYYKQTPGKDGKWKEKKS